MSIAAIVTNVLAIFAAVYSLETNVNTVFGPNSQNKIDNPIGLVFILLIISLILGIFTLRNNRKIGALLTALPLLLLVLYTAHFYPQFRATRDETRLKLEQDEREASEYATEQEENMKVEAATKALDAAALAIKSKDSAAFKALLLPQFKADPSLDSTIEDTLIPFLSTALLPFPQDSSKSYSFGESATYPELGVIYNISRSLRNDDYQYGYYSGEVAEVNGTYLVLSFKVGKFSDL